VIALGRRLALLRQHPTIPGTHRRGVIVTRLCLGLLMSSLAMAERGTDAPLTDVRTWSLAGDALAPPRAGPSHRLLIEMGIVRGTHWSPDVIVDAARRASAILAQCDIRVGLVRLHEFDAPDRYRYLSMPDSREFARRSGLRKPAVFFVDDTRQRPAFDAEAIGRSNAATRPEMADTVWITAGIRDLPIALAHELVHVLSDSGAHSNAPGNLMNDETAPGNTQLTSAQCSRIVATGEANGLLDAAARDGPR
jgi:hypothetical protein